MHTAREKQIEVYDLTESLISFIQVVHSQIEGPLLQLTR